MLGAVSLGIYGLLGLAWLERGLLSCQNVLFDADVARVTDDVTSWAVRHWRTSTHPIFPLLMLPLGVTGSSVAAPSLVALALVVLSGALTVSLSGTLLRRLLSEPDAALLTVLYAASASSLFMFSIVDTFALAAAAIAAALCLADSRPWAHRLSAVAAMGVMLTNVVHVAGSHFWVAPCRARPTAGGAVRFGVQCTAAVASLAALQWAVVPNTRHFLLPAWILKERRYLAPIGSATDALSRLTDTLIGFVGHALLAPEPRYLQRSGYAIERVTFVGAAHSTAGGLLAVTAALLLAWATGVNASRGWSCPRTRATAAALGFHLVLMLLYGSEPLLYSPLWTLSLVLWLALALRRPDQERLRRPPRWLLGAFAAGTLLSNSVVAHAIVRHYDGAVPCDWRDRECIRAFYRQGAGGP